MYNKILKRPMFRRGGSSFQAQGTGITSPYDVPRGGYYGGGTIGGGMIHGNPMGNRTGFEDPKTLEDLTVEKTEIFAPKKNEWLNDVVESFGEYSNVKNEDGSYKTIGEMGYNQANILEEKRNVRQDKRDLAKLSGLESEEAALIRGEEQVNALEMQALINSKEIELDKQYKAVDAKYKFGLDQLQAKIDNPALLLPGETKKSVQEDIQNIKRKIAEDKYEIARKMPVKQTRAEKVDALALIIYQTKNKKADGVMNKGISLADAKEEAEAYYPKAKGGRVGYQDGTGMNGAQPMQASMNMAETGENQSTVDMSYEEFRGKIPAEVEDNIVQLIYYNEDAFADFASIVEQSDVDEFNNKYHVSLILPMTDAMV